MTDVRVRAVDALFDLRQIHLREFTTAPDDRNSRWGQVEPNPRPRPPAVEPPTRREPVEGTQTRLSNLGPAGAPRRGEA